MHRNQGAIRHPRRCNDTNGNKEEEEEIYTIQHDAISLKGVIFILAAVRI
jgi:hypothetical protein